MKKKPAKLTPQALAKLPPYERDILHAAEHGPDRESTQCELAHIVVFHEKSAKDVVRDYLVARQKYLPAMKQVKIALENLYIPDGGVREDDSGAPGTGGHGLA